MNAPRLSAAALTVGAFAALAMAGAAGGCGPNDAELHICLNPVTGKIDDTIYDVNHYVNGVFDPCHCYDPSGPSKSCPIVVDAGPDAP